MLMGRVSMITGWYHLIRRKFTSKQEFVSLDAKNSNNIEMLKFQNDSIRSAKEYPDAYAEVDVTSPASTYSGDMVDRKSPTDFVSPQTSWGSPDERVYRTPSMSFSQPRRQSRGNVWEPSSTFARGGFGLHPTIKDEEEFG